MKLSSKKILITGGAGFVGSHLIEGLLKNTNWHIYIIDRIDLAGNLERLKDLETWEKNSRRVNFFWHDLKSEIPKFLLNEINDINYVWHVAASSHVDRSIEDPSLFVMDNVLGTTNLLIGCRKMSSLEKIIYLSTDEVFGPAEDGVNYKEWDRYNSSNPYAASKAGGEEMSIAFANTYKLPVIVVHVMNIFGERQYSEKFIPSTIKKIINGETVKIHGDKEKIKPGSRFYIHASSVCDALLFLNKKGNCLDGSGKNGKYNIVGEREINNLELAQIISKVIKKPLKYEIVDFHSSRPGHDMRYSLCGELMKKNGWKQQLGTEKLLKKTIKWYLNNKKWLDIDKDD